MGALLDDFLVRALIAGLGVALVTGPLGAFVVWRRMAFFGSTLAHSALLGVALGLLLDWDLIVGVTALCVIVSFALAILRTRSQLADDTLLGILAHGTLALGLVAVGFLETVRFDLMGYLFGDILAVGIADLVWIYVGGAAVLAVLVTIWRPLLALTVHEGLAVGEGVPVARINMLFMLLMAVVVAVAMKIVGILLVVAMLIIPAAAARRYSRTPEQMAIIAAIIGMLSVAGGLVGSLSLDTPAGPSIVLMAMIFFGLGIALPRWSRARGAA
ncbi:MAG: metal ABC transporter permease [Proteobacteria bacterium]|nr:metal ABC transporter permease [Pseudomonadota bacterium]